MKPHLRCGGLIAAVALLAACGGEPAEQAAGGAGAEVDATPLEIALEPVNHVQWARRLEDFRPAIVVVDMWATWCAPCIERFPKMVALNDKYASEGVVIVGMSLEDRDDAGALEGAEAFLERQGAYFPNFLMDENILDSFDKLDILGIPAVDIYDRSGERRYRLTGDDPNNQFTDADIEAAIKTL
ncbi:MAG: TlpA disulfide reductase family protein, partial [Pseudomonadota bacterium]